MKGLKFSALAGELFVLLNQRTKLLLEATGIGGFLSGKKLKKKAK